MIKSASSNLMWKAEDMTTGMSYSHMGRYRRTPKQASHFLLMLIYASVAFTVGSSITMIFFNTILSMMKSSGPGNVW